MTGSAYREHPAATATRAVRCTWERTTGASGAAVDVLPDGCADLVWTGGALVVAGPDRSAVRHVMEPGDAAVGARLATGWAGAALGLPAAELANLRVPAEDIWGAPARELAELLAAAGDGVRRALLVDAVDARMRTAPADRAVLAAVRRMEAGASPSVGALAADVGLGERHLRRRFAAAVGYGPRTLARVLRLRRALEVAERDGACSIARLAAEAGYADAPHLARETAALAGRTPTELVARWTTRGPERP